MATTRSRYSRTSGPPPKGRTPPGGSGGRGRRKKRNVWVVRLQIFFTFVLIVVLAGILGGIVAIAQILKEMPSSTTDILTLEPAGRSQIYSSDGTVLASLFSQNRQIVTIDHVPANLKNATVAIEDSRFYTNNYGVDFRGITRALFHNIQGGDMTGQGGSTITQQLVRNLGIEGIGHQKSLMRKVREAVYAFKIDQNFSKEQILEMYLNQVYYGSGAYGVQAAAETYFGRPVDNLDLSQCALIAGLVQRPSRLSPYVDKAAAIERRNIVLGRMRDLGYISDSDCATASAEPIVLAFTKPPSSGNQIYHAPYFVDYVVKQLLDKYGEEVIFRGGLKITTTLNWQMQAAAEQAVADGVSNNGYLGLTDAALVAMDQHTGFIKAMVGGLNYQKSQYNIAAFGHRQPGSSFKPVIYTAALDSGLISEQEPINDEPITLPGANGNPWSPKNDDDTYHRYEPAEWGVAWSANVMAVRVLQMLGVDTAIHYASMMGITSPLAPYLTLALGTSAVTPLEMCRMYALISNQGALPTPQCIETIEQNDGTPLEVDQPEMITTSISVKALEDMGKMLRAVVTYGTASAVFRDNNPPDACGKTGTTQEHRDVWFDGYTSKLTCVVWAGHPSVDPNTGKVVYLPMHGEAFGATICAPIWKQFMVAANTIIANQAAHVAKAAAAATIPPTTPRATVTAVPTTTTAQQKTTATTTPATITSQPVAPEQQTDTADPAAQLSPDGKTVTVWIDDTTGLRAAANAPGSHQETFVTGTEPTTYVDGSEADETVDTTPPKQKMPVPGPTNPPTTTQAHVVAGSTQKSIPTPEPMVTVEICVESGMRATEWCPETIEKQFPANQVPKYCTLHKPPPGE
jgi:penicillin-binding protein 1A